MPPTIVKGPKVLRPSGSRAATKQRAQEQIRDLTPNLASSAPSDSLIPSSEGLVRRIEEDPQLLREACHDMRQPIAGILRLAALALTQLGVPNAARSCLEQIVTQTVYLEELIHQFLYVGEPNEANAQTDLTHLAAEAVAAEQVTYKGKVKLLSPAKPVLIRVSHVDARRIISNLLGNATRAAGPQGTATIEVACDHRIATVTVEDSDPGFGKIPKVRGLGMGIIAQSLARCGGRLEYGAASIDGVRASLWLPLAA